MTPIDFYQLDRTAQERFVGSVNGSGLPAPILRSNPQSMTPRLWLALSGAAAVAIAALSLVGFGRLDSDFAIQHRRLLVAYVGLAACLVFGVLRALANRRAFRASPFRPGVYVFPIGLIDARLPKLRLYPLDGLVGVFGPDVRGITLDFGRVAFSFPVSDPVLAEESKRAIARAKDDVTEAAASRESIRPKALAALDPLQGYANPLVSSQRMTEDRPPWAKFAWLISAGAGLLLGALVWLGRNAKSDDAMFARAASADDASAYTAYLSRGTRHRSEVSLRLLPRAQLREAETVGTVAAIEAFLKDHPAGEVAVLGRSALKKALLAELDGAIKVGTLAALNEFSARYDHTLVDSELARARHTVYANALAAYMAQATDKGSAAAAVVQRIVAWSEQKGPTVDVRFRAQRSKTMEKADRAAGQSRQWKGVVSLPSRYFDAGAEKGDREALFAALSQRFAEVLSPEVVSFHAVEPVGDADAGLPDVQVPTLFIDTGEVWAGSVQASQKPRGVFVGLDLSLEGQFRFPDASKTLKVKVDSWHVPELAAARDSDKPEEVVYATMRARAFEQFRKKFLATFFSK